MTDRNTNPMMTGHQIGEDGINTMLVNTHKYKHTNTTTQTQNVVAQHQICDNRFWWQAVAFFLSDVGALVDKIGVLPSNATSGEKLWQTLFDVVHS